MNERWCRKNFTDYSKCVSKSQQGNELLPPILPPNNSLIKIKGVLECFSVVKALEYFEDGEYDPVAFEKQKERDQFGALLLSMLGNAAGAAVTMQGKIRLNEPASFVQGKINGISFNGWLGMTRAQVGDDVEMIVSPDGDSYTVYAISHPEIKILSIVPRCSLGLKENIKQGAKLAHGFVLSFYVIVMLFFICSSIYYGDEIVIGKYAIASSFFVFIDIFLILLNKYLEKSKVRPTVMLAELIFNRLGFREPENINLSNITKKKLKEMNDYQVDRNDADGRPLPGKNCDSEYFYYY